MGSGRWIKGVGNWRKSMQYIVFGLDSYVGSYLYKKLEEHNKKVIGTSRHCIGNENGKIFFDLKEDHDYKSILNQISGKEKIAILCIAETKIDRCFESYKESYEINVEKTKKLIHELIQNGFQVIYFSTDNVFDGVCGNYTEQSDTNALNQYGMMKAEMEQFLLENEKQACIFRISKVISTCRDRRNLLTEWEDSISRGVIYCIKDNRISFICLEDIYNACVLATERKLQGLYNIVGDESYTRSELARKFYSMLGVHNMNIVEMSLEEFSFKDCRPLNVSMSNWKFKKETGYAFMKMETVLNKYITNIRKII